MALRFHCPRHCKYSIDFIGPSLTCINVRDEFGDVLLAYEVRLRIFSTL